LTVRQLAGLLVSVGIQKPSSSSKMGDVLFVSCILVLVGAFRNREEFVADIY
jgi:hypothetical protein